MRRIFRIIKHNTKMKRLRKNFDYCINKMEELQGDEEKFDDWISYCELGSLYLDLMMMESLEYSRAFIR